MENENDNENNFFIVQNEEKENLEEEEKEKEKEEEEEDELTNALLSNLLNKAEKKNKNVINKKRNRNEALMNNVIELNENYEIISNFAPTTKELIEKLFSKDFSEDLNYNKNKTKVYFNPEEYAKKNNLNQFFFDGEELINSVVENINEESKELINNKIKNQKENLIIEKKTDNELCKNNNLIEIKKEKEIEQEIKEELFEKNEIDNKNEIEEEEKGFELYDLCGDINREGIKNYVLEFYNLKHLNYKERIKYGKLINQISQLCPKRKEKKLNFVIDLDFTLKCATALN